MDIASLCQRAVVTIDEGANIQQAASLMRDRHVGALVITSEQDGSSQLAGVVTDRDLALYALAAGLDVNTRVDAITQGSVVSVPRSASVADAVATMRDAGVRRLVVVDAHRQLAGIVSLDDLIRAYAAEMGDLAAALERGIEHEVDHPFATEGVMPKRVLVPEELAAAWRRVVQP